MKPMHVLIIVSHLRWWVRCKQNMSKCYKHNSEKAQETKSWTKFGERLQLKKMWAQLDFFFSTQHDYAVPFNIYLYNCLIKECWVKESKRLTLQHYCLQTHNSDKAFGSPRQPAIFNLSITEFFLWTTRLRIV